MIHFTREPSKWATDTCPCEVCGYRLTGADFATDWLGRVAPDCPQCAGRVHARPKLRVVQTNHAMRECRDCNALFEQDRPQRRLCEVCRELNDRPRQRLSYAKHKEKKLARLRLDLEAWRTMESA